jgi:hypothetical protein
MRFPCRSGVSPTHSPAKACEVSARLESVRRQSSPFLQIPFRWNRPASELLNRKIRP